MRAWAFFCLYLLAVTSHAWELQPTESTLTCAVAITGAGEETYRFHQLSGSLDNAGVALLTIPLAGFDSGEGERDQRVRSVLFDSSKFPNANLLATVDMGKVSLLAVGEEARLRVNGSLTLRGKTAQVSADSIVTRLPGDRLKVVSVQPVPVDTADFELGKPMRKLMGFGDREFGTVIPISFTLVFTP